MLIQHITLCTGHVATHRLDTLSGEAVAACRSLLPSGGQIPGFSAFRVEIVGSVFTIFRGREPLVTCGVGHGADDAWQALVELQTHFAPVTVPPPALPWLAVAILPGMTLLARADIGWLGDFERCLAAAMLLPEAKNG